MNKYSYKIEVVTEADLTKEQQETFLFYFKYKMDTISVLPEEIEKKIEKIIDIDSDLEIIIKKFKIEDEI
jgi:hypothetical protein